MLNLFPRHQYMDTSVSSVYFQGLCRQQWLKDEILSVAVTTVSIDPKWQSQDLKPLLRPITQKDTIERWFCPKHFTMCFSEKRWQGGCKSADWGIPWNREFGQQEQQQFQSPRCLFIVGLVGHHFCACDRNWGTARVGTSYLHCSHKWAFLWMTLSFYLLFWTNHVIKEQDLTFALTSLASTVSACCLWPLPEIHLCWASCCLLWLLVDLFLLWLQWWFYELPLSTELREMVREKGFLDFSSGCRLSPLTNSPLV